MRATSSPSHLAPMEGGHDRLLPLHFLYRRERRRRRWQGPRTYRACIACPPSSRRLCDFKPHTNSLPPKLLTSSSYATARYSLVNSSLEGIAHLNASLDRSAERADSFVSCTGCNASASDGILSANIRVSACISSNAIAIPSLISARSIIIRRPISA